MSESVVRSYVAKDPHTREKFRVVETVSQDGKTAACSWELILSRALAKAGREVRRRQGGAR